MRSQIEIETRTLGKTSRFRAIGDIDCIAEGAAITYPIEGDVSKLEFFRDRIILTRRGHTSFDAVFSLGQISAFRFSDGDNFSELSVLTSVCKSFFSGSELHARLGYDLGTGPSQHFSLRIKIKVLSEDQ